MTMQTTFKFSFEERNKSKPYDYTKNAITKLKRSLVPSLRYSVKEMAEVSGLSQRVVRAILKDKKLPVQVDFEGRKAYYSMPAKDEIVVVLKEHKDYGVVAVIPEQTSGDKVKFILNQGTFRIVEKAKFDAKTTTLSGEKLLEVEDKWTKTIHAMFGRTASFKTQLKKVFFGD